MTMPGFAFLTAGAFSFKQAAASGASAYADNGTSDDEVYVEGAGASAAVNDGSWVVGATGTGGYNLDITADTNAESSTIASAEAVDTDSYYYSDYAAGSVTTRSAAESNSTFDLNLWG